MEPGPKGDSIHDEYLMFKMIFLPDALYGALLDAPVMAGSPA